MSAIADRVAAWWSPLEPTVSPHRAPFLRRLAATAASTGVLIAVFLLLQRFVDRVCRFPDPDAAAASILAACVERRPLLLLPALAAGALLLAAFPRLRQGWRQFDGGESLRWFVTAVAVLLAWAGSAYPYNAWYDQAHLADRAAIVLLAALVPWRPVFVLPFVIAFWAVMWQFDVPPLGFQILVAEFRPVLNVLTMFSAALLVQAVSGSRDVSAFLFLVLCIVAANFWVPGLAKLQIGWIAHGHVYFLLPNAYTHGWLGFLEPEAIARAGEALARADWPMRIGTLIVECGALLVLAGARTARTLLVAFTVLLGAFFLTLGYLFWKWIALHVALWVVLFGSAAPPAAVWRRDLFSGVRFAVSVVVIGGAGYWCAPAALAWFDTPLTNTLHYEGVGRSGAVYDLPPGFFAPYESHVAMATFAERLIGEPLLATSYGVTASRPMADALLGARDPSDVIRIETAVRPSDGVAIDRAFAEQFDRFVRRTAIVSNRGVGDRVGVRRLLSFVAPPPFLWTFGRGRPYRHDEPLASIRVYWVSSLFDGREYVVFRRVPVRSIDLGGEAPRDSPG